MCINIKYTGQQFTLSGKQLILEDTVFSRSAKSPRDWGINSTENARTLHTMLKTMCAASSAPVALHLQCLLAGVYLTEPLLETPVPQQTLSPSQDLTPSCPSLAWTPFSPTPPSPVARLCIIFYELINFYGLITVSPPSFLSSQSLPATPSPCPPSSPLFSSEKSRSSMCINQSWHINLQ